VVPLNRALSKLGILSRAQATEAIRAGRVKVDGRVVINPAATVVPERVRITVDGMRRARAAWRMILFHKPRGVVTTRHDPQGRPTIYDVMGHAASGLVAVGRLDLATSGLLLLTTDTRLAHRITDPGNAVPRVYLVTARGRVTDDEAAALDVASVIVRKASARETQLTVELRRGRNREVRKLFEAIGHEVTRLKRVRFGGLDLGRLAPGEWRELTRTEVEAAFRRRM
jgi:23S rRNA pseudouridine2605 synthase